MSDLRISHDNNNTVCLCVPMKVQNGSMYSHANKTELRERKPPPTPKFQPKVIHDFNLDRRINPDTDVCKISPKTWIHYLVGVSHFAKFHKNWSMTVREMLINLLKSPTLQW